jgi:hypothetical protein
MGGSVGSRRGCLRLLRIARDNGGGYAAAFRLGLSRVYVKEDVTAGCVGPPLSSINS